MSISPLMSGSGSARDPWVLQEIEELVETVPMGGLVIEAVPVPVVENGLVGWDVPISDLIDLETASVTAHRDPVLMYSAEDPSGRVPEWEELLGVEV